MREHIVFSASIVVFNQYSERRVRELQTHVDGVSACLHERARVSLPGRPAAFMTAAIAVTYIKPARQRPRPPKIAPVFMSSEQVHNIVVSLSCSIIQQLMSTKSPRCTRALAYENPLWPQGACSQLVPAAQLVTYCALDFPVSNRHGERVR